jgi:hypothetical protein
VGPIDAGAAWVEFLGRPRTARVVAVPTRAIYLQSGETVVALVARDVPSGPIHLRVDPLPVTHVNERLVVDGGGLTVGGCRVDAGDVPRWERPVVDPAALMAIAEHAPARLELACRSALARDPVIEQARVALVRGDLETAVTALAGRGVGLTPAGDDVLAGAFVVLALATAPAGLGRAAASARTHPIARAFLAWAARGQSIEPVHRLLVALVAGDDEGVWRHQQRVADLGHTSGADLLLGLRVGFSALG